MVKAFDRTKTYNVFKYKRDPDGYPSSIGKFVSSHTTEKSAYKKMARERKKQMRKKRIKYIFSLVRPPRNIKKKEGVSEMVNVIQDFDKWFNEWIIKTEW